MAAAVRGAMDDFEESSSDEEDHRVVRRRPPAAGSRGAHGPRGSGARPISGSLADEAASREAYAVAREEAAFARATNAHMASVAAEHSSERAATSAAGSTRDRRAGGAGAAASAAAAEVCTDAEADALRTRLLLPARAGTPACRCYVVRQKSLFSAPIWRLYSEGDDQFLMSAQKRGASRTSNFLLATELVPTRGSGRVVGKVRSNFAGSVYTIFDSGMAPEDAVTDASLRRELAVVGFDWDQMGPGKMRAAVPRVHKNGAPFTFRAREAVDSLAAAAAHADSTRVVMLKNKRPQWDDSVGGHVLNFGGRVTCPSVKNFQMGSDESEDATLLQFGKVDKDRFTLDFQHPLCHVQAFGIVMAAIDGKLADRRALKRFSGKTPEEDGGAWFAQWADPPAPET